MPVIQIIELSFLILGGFFNIFENGNYAASFISACFYFGSVIMEFIFDIAVRKIKVGDFPIYLFLIIVCLIRMDILYKRTNGYHIITNFKKFIDDNKRPETKQVEFLQQQIKRAKELSEIINKTCDFGEFVNSFGEIIEIMTFLQELEPLEIFSNGTPTEDLQELQETKPVAEKLFIDRFVYQNGKEKLLENKIYFEKLCGSTVEYINSLI